MVSSFCYQRLTRLLPAHASLFYEARFIVFSVLCETKAYKYTLIKVCSSMLCKLLKSISFVFKCMLWTCYEHVITFVPEIMEGIKNNTVTNSHCNPFHIFNILKRLQSKQGKTPSMARLFLKMPLSSLKNKKWCVRWMSYFWGKLLMRVVRTKQTDIEADHLTKQYENK